MSNEDINWFKLYAKDPEQYEITRVEHIAQEIKKIAKGNKQVEERLVARQWRFEQDMRNHTGLARYNATVVAFWRMFHEFKEVIK